MIFSKFSERATEGPTSEEKMGAETGGSRQDDGSSYEVYRSGQEVHWGALCQEILAPRM